MNKIIASLVLLLGLAPSALAWPNAAITPGQNITSASAGALQPAGPGAYSGNLVNEAGLAYSNTFLLDMAQYNAREVSVQTIFSTVTYTSPTISDGRTSSGTVTVVDYTKLSSATATNQVTVTTNSFGSTLPNLIVGNCSLTMGKDYSRGATRNATATNLATAINACNPLIAASASANVIYTTATYGSYANSYAFVSNNSSITVAAATMTGGQDNACLTINATSICAGANFTAATSSVTTASRIVTAINANTTLAAIVVASSTINNAAAYGVLTVTSLLNGTAYNYAFTSSDQTNLKVKDSGGLLIGGLDSGFTLSSKKITGSSAVLTRGLPVLWAIGSNSAIGGLTTGTTYYAVPAGGNSFFLAKYSTSAVAGLSADYATVTSTTSGSTNHNYTLAPLAWAGSATYIWQTSNDNSTWSTAPSTGTVTLSSSTSFSPLSTNWGVLGYRYLRLNFTAQTSGATALQVPVYLKQD